MRTDCDSLINPNDKTFQALLAQLCCDPFRDEKIRFATNSDAIDDLVAGDRFNGNLRIASFQLHAEIFSSLRTLEGADLHSVKGTSTRTPNFHSALKDS